MELSHLLISVGLVAVLYFFARFQRRWYGEALEPEQEIEKIQKKREKIKVKSKEKKVLREKLVTTGIIIGAIWIPFYLTMMRRAMVKEGTATWLTDLTTIVVFLILASMFIHGFLKQMGTLAIRGKQKSETGRRTKKFEVLLGSHHPLDPALIRNALKIWDEKQPETILWAKDGAVKAGDYYDLEWDDPEGKRRTLIHKDRATFMETLSRIDVERIKADVDTALQRRLGENASIAQLVTAALQVRMKTLDFDDRDAMMFQLLIEGLKPLDKEADSKKAQIHQAKVRQVVEWVLTDRLGLPPESVEHLWNQVDIPNEIQPIHRLVEDGVFFGGYHAEFARLYQYDTDHVIFVVPYPFFEAFSFSDRDWIDASYMPFPLPYTDFDWRVIGTVVVQTAPKEFEACNILVPIYTDKDLRDLPGLIPPHPIDQVTKRELSIFFVEESADQLLEENIELKTTLQRKELFEGPNRKLLAKQLNKLWLELNRPIQILKAIWPYVGFFAVIAAVVGYFLGGHFKG